MKKVKDFFKEFYYIFTKKEITVLPANLAYFFFTSTIPIITILIYAATSFSLSFNVVMKFLEETVSKQILNTILPIIEKSSLNGPSIFILVALFIVASNGAHSIIIASNTVFNIENKSYFYRMLKAMIITLILVLLFVFLLVVPMFGQSILKLFSYIGIQNEITFTFNMLYPILKYPISIIIVFLLVKLIYTIAPNEKIKSEYVNKGALFTTAGWVIISAVYSVYINDFAITTYNLYYGSLASIIIILLWFYLMAYIFVIGLVLNYRDMEKQIEKTNKIKLSEIKNKVDETIGMGLSKK